MADLVPTRWAFVHSAQRPIKRRLDRPWRAGALADRL